MEPVDALVIGAISLLGPYFAESAKSFATKAGEAAWTRSVALYQLIRAKFQGHPDAEKALEDFKADPNDITKQSVMRGELIKVLEKDQDFLEQLRKLLAESKQANIIVTGSGAVATSGGTAAGAGGIAVHHNEGGIHIGSSRQTTEEPSKE